MDDLTKNIDNLNGYLARFRDIGVQNHIGGKMVPAASGKVFDNASPVDESHICAVARGDAVDIDAAAKAAGRDPVEFLGKGLQVELE